MKFLLPFIFILTLSCNLSHVAAAQSNDSISVNSAATLEPATDGWISIKGDVITVWCLPDANLKNLEARLRIRDVPVNQEYRTLLSNRSLSMEDKLKARLEIILLRDEEVLGMYPQDLRVKVRIFKNRRDMNDTYAQMFNEHTNFKSFYMHYFKSIYTNEADFVDSVIAHELGHAVIDYYFSIPPPSKMAELMAIYVDTHLDED